MKTEVLNLSQQRETRSNLTLRSLAYKLILKEVDGLVASKLIAARDELSQSINQKIQAEIKKVLSDDKIEMEKKYVKMRRVCFITLGLSLTAFGVVLLVNL